MRTSELRLRVDTRNTIRIHKKYENLAKISRYSDIIIQKAKELLLLKWKMPDAFAARSFVVQRLVPNLIIYLLGSRRISESHSYNIIIIIKFREGRTKCGYLRDLFS